MINVDNMTFGLLTYPQAKDNGDFANNTYIDTQGYHHLRVLMAVGVLDTPIGSTAEGNAVKLEEADNADFSDASDISGAALADAIADDEDGKLFAIDVDLTKSHKRYMRINAPHAGDGTTGATFCAIGILSRADRGPTTAAQKGLAELIQA